MTFLISDFDSYLKLGMYDNGNNDGVTTPCIGNAWIGYDCKNKILFAADRIDSNYMERNGLCEVKPHDGKDEEQNSKRRVQFAMDSALLLWEDAISFNYTRLSGGFNGE